MDDVFAELLSERAMDERALAFDLDMRASLRRLILQLLEKGWSRAEIALALSEMADEVLDSDVFPDLRRRDAQ